ncbi:unnamed protein product [Mytilus coruscus]|uniref:Uncharacterized protein n=1 Tax=Mytilus coruscus TaxID=42192 RepID=A0A6J8BM03_MYTCO|nr:unnamed protein product [Mytilus coruscus]
MSNITTSQEKAMKSLLNDSSINMRPADKGLNKVVIDSIHMQKIYRKKSVTVLHTQFMMSDYICNWSNCEFGGSKNLAIRHVILCHAPQQNVPYFCTLCSFRATYMKAFNRHHTTFGPHVLLAKENPQSNDYLDKSSDLYNVTWGNRHCDLTLKEENLCIYSQI